MMIIAPHDLGLVRGNQQNTQGDWQDKAVQRANHNQDLGWLTDEIEDRRGKNDKSDRNQTEVNVEPKTEDSPAAINTSPKNL